MYLSFSTYQFKRESPRQQKRKTSVARIEKSYYTLTVPLVRKTSRDLLHKVI